MKNKTDVGYSGRDVINARALKQSIKLRCFNRGNSEEVCAWLTNHFFRYLVGSLKAPSPQLMIIKTIEQAQKQFKSSPLPEWLFQRLKSKDELWWIDPDGEVLLGLEQKLVEFLSSRKGTSLEGKLNRVNCFQALAIWQHEHDLMEAKAATFWREHNSDAVEVLWQDKNGKFVEFLPDSSKLRAEMAYESQMMRHCLGQFADKKNLTGGYGEHYALSCEEGKMRLFSYRTGQAQPRITISSLVKGDGQLQIEQIKGKQNRPPIARYAEAVTAFLNMLVTNKETPEDASLMGVVRLDKGWRRVESIIDENEQLSVLIHHPAQVSRLIEPSLLVQWLAVAQNPELALSLDLDDGPRKALEQKA